MVKTEAVGLEGEQLQLITPLVDEYIDLPIGGIEPHIITDKARQAIEPLAKIRLSVIQEVPVPVAEC
jgi:hypothetical protein